MKIRLLFFGLIVAVSCIPTPKDELPLVPIGLILDTDLYTGLYYQIRMKTFPEAFLTWTEKQVNDEDGNYIQIDRQPGNLIYYKTGKKWEDDVQWGFEPAERTDYFFLRNKALGKRTALFRVEDVTNYFTIATTEVGKLKGGELDGALVKPVGTKLKEYYRFESKLNPEGVITWTAKNYGNYSHFIHLVENKTSFYQEGGKGYEDTLFKFPSITDQNEGLPLLLFQAVVTNFQFGSSNDFDKKDKFELKTTFPTYVWRSNAPKMSVRFYFDREIGWLNLLEGAVPLPDIYGENMQIRFRLDDKYLQGSAEYLAIVGGTGGDGGLELGKREWAFRAWVKVTGHSDRMVVNGNGFTMGVLPVALVYDRLLAHKLQSDSVKMDKDGGLYVLLTGNVTVERKKEESGGRNMARKYYPAFCIICGIVLVGWIGRFNNCL